MRSDRRVMPSNTIARSLSLRPDRRASWPTRPEKTWMLWAERCSASWLHAPQASWKESCLASKKNLNEQGTRTTKSKSGTRAESKKPGRTRFCCITNRGPSLAAQGWSDAQNGANSACTLVIHDNDAFRGDCAFSHLERRRDRAIGKQSFSTAQRDRKYFQPERIDQIMLEECLNEICASVNVQIRPFQLLNFGDFFRNISV